AIGVNYTGDEIPSHENPGGDADPAHGIHEGDIIDSGESPEMDNFSFSDETTATGIDVDILDSGIDPVDVLTETGHELFETILNLGDLLLESAPIFSFFRSKNISDSIDEREHSLRVRKLATDKEAMRYGDREALIRIGPKYGIKFLS